MQYMYSNELKNTKVKFTTCGMRMPIRAGANGRHEAERQNGGL